MVMDADNIEVNGWFFDAQIIEHIGRHFVEEQDVRAAWASGPLYFRNLPNRSATHIMIGEDGKGRVIYAAIYETETLGIWQVASAWESRIARRLWNDRRRK